MTDKPPSPITALVSFGESIPRLQSLVATELQTLSRAPFDRKLFALVFTGVLAGILALGLLAPILLKPRPVITHLETAAHKAAAPAETKAAPKIVSASNERQTQAIANNDKYTHDPLARAPVDALEEPFSDGAIPRIGEDGRKPWFVYSRPFDKADPRPRLYVVLAELGLSRLLSEAAISDLPDSVTLSFSSTSNAADAWMIRARNLGHEVLLSVPMEPLDFPMSDPGPNTLLVQNNAKENIHRLAQHMTKGKGYVGITTLSGSRFSTAPEALRPVLSEVKKRGMLWLDAKLSPLSSAEALAKEIGLPSVKTDFHVTADASAAAMARIFDDAEKSAQSSGSATLVVFASPLSINVMRDWLKTLPEKGFALAPLSAAAE